MPNTLADRFHNFHFTVPGAHISAKAVVYSGVAAGVAFLLLELVMAPLFMGLSPWTPIRMIAAITMGASMLSPPDTFDSGALIAATVIHFALSLAYALAFAFVAKGRSRMTDTILGAAFGLLLYAVNFYGFSYMFPWFAEARHWATIVAHVVFGGVLGFTYASIVKRMSGAESMPHHHAA